MGFENVALRGGTYYWRKKVTVSGTPLTFALPLKTGVYKNARVIALRLGMAIETLCMAYGQSPGLDPQQLKQVFNDAMRWQLRRILADQTSSAAPAGSHATINSIHAAAWDFLGRHGVEEQWTIDELNGLIDDGWKMSDAKAVGDAVFDYQTTQPVSKTQLDSYLKAFRIEGTTNNLDLIKRIICEARAAACREATSRLSADNKSTSSWIPDALADASPFAFEQVDDHCRAPARPPVEGSSETLNDSLAATPAKLPQPTLVKTKRLLDAAEECIALHEQQKAWDVVSVGQVRTALRLFDYACGGNVSVEDLEQRHVAAFTALCRALPNRWGRTTAEKAGGIAASLDRAQTMAKDEVGVGQATINKHVTWIVAVLKHAAGDGEADGHRPALPLSFEAARAGVGRKARQQRKRHREKRASWTKQEVARLLSAPIWTGSAGIDHRLKPGAEIIHDAWYWMPLMLPLYGGRSSELAGLAISEVHENDEIPYFLVDYTDDRSLKTVQSIRKLPIHPELIRLGFIDYVAQIRAAGCKMLFPELASENSKSFASTFYKSIFQHWRNWAERRTARGIAACRRRRCSH